jgi:hypothetical protein
MSLGVHSGAGVRHRLLNLELLTSAGGSSSFCEELFRMKKIVLTQWRAL